MLWRQVLIWLLYPCINQVADLTQSSLLLTGPNVNWEYVSQIINLTQTTSASYLLLSSLDISRRNLYMRGESSLPRLPKWHNMPVKKLTALQVLCLWRRAENGGSIYDFDITKLSVYTRDIGLAGIEVYDLCVTNMIFRLNLVILLIF